MGATGKRRAPNKFQGAGKIPAAEWARAVRMCQDAWEGCVPCTVMPTGFPKDRPKRTKGMGRLEWRATVDEYSLALMEAFGHRELVKSKNPDHTIRTSVWTCGECTLQVRTTLTLEGAWGNLQVQGVTQSKVDDNVFSMICALPPAPTCRTHTCQTPTCKHPMCQTPLCQEHMPHTPFSHSLRFGVEGRG